MSYLLIHIGTYDFILTIFFSQLIQRLYDFADENGGTLPIKTYFFLDEFANIGRIPDFDRKISTSRSRGISFSVILQSLDQLESVYEKTYETIMGNCDTHLFLGSNSQKTVEYFSKALGEKTIKRENISKSINDKSEQSKTYSDNLYGRNLMTPDELRRMHQDECIIFEKGVKPIKASKFYWFKDKRMNAELSRNITSHLDYKVERGDWRIFDPYNKKSVEEKKDTVTTMFKEEQEKAVKKEEKINIDNNVDSLKKLQDVDINNIKINMDKDIKEDLKTDLSQVAKGKDIKSKIEKEEEKLDSIDDFDELVNLSEKKQKEKENRPSRISNYDEFDIEKELEKKFDELFRQNR